MPMPLEELTEELTESEIHLSENKDTTPLKQKLGMKKQVSFD